MSKRKKYILITLGAMTGLFIAVVVGARVYLSTSHAQKMIQAKIDAAIPGAVTWDDLGFSLAGGRVELTNVLLAGPEGEKLAGFDRLFLDIAMKDLFKKKVTMAEFVLEKPWADVIRDENGRLNLMAAFPESGPPLQEEPKEASGELPVDIFVALARISDGWFRFRDMGTGVDATVSGVGLDVSFELAGKAADIAKAMAGDVRFEIASGQFKSPDLETALETFLAEASLQEGRIDPLRLEVKTVPARIDLSGSVAGVFDKPEVDAALTMDLALGQIRELLSLKPPLSGDLGLKLAVSGQADNPTADLSLSYGGGDLFDYAVNAIALKASLADRVLDLKTLNIDAKSGKAQLSGWVDAKAAFPDGFLAQNTMKLNALSYQLHLIGDKVVLDKVIPASVGVRGTAGTDLLVKGTGVLYPAIDADIVLTLNGRQIQTPGVKDALNVAAQTDAALSSNGVVTIQTLSIKAGDADLSVDGKFDIPNLTTSAHIDLKAPKLGQTLASLGIAGISGGAILKADIDGPVTSPVFDVDLTGKGLAFQDITVGDIRLDAASDKTGTVNIATLSIENQGSQIKASGSAGVFDGQSMQLDPDLPLNIVLNLKNLEAGDFLKTPPVTGDVSGLLTAAGKLMDLRVGVDLEARQLATDAAAIGDVDLKAGLENGTVTIAGLSVRNQQSSVNLKGKADILKPGEFTPLDDPGFDLSLSSKSIVLADFLPQAGGSVGLAAQVRGRLSQPAVDVQLDAKGLAFEDIRIGDATLDAALEPSGRLAIQRLFLSNQGSEIEGKGTIRLYENKPGFDPALPLDVALTLTNVEAKDFVKADLAQGQISGQVKATGSIKNPVADLALQTQGLAVQGTQIGSVDLNGIFANGRAEIEQIKVTNQNSDLLVSGTAQVLSADDMTPLADPSYDLAIVSDSLFLQDFLPAMKGRLVLKADLSGSVKQPKGTIDLSGDALDLGAQKLSGIRLSARMTGDRIHIDPLEATIRKGETLTVAGVYTLPDAYDLTIQSPGVSLSSIDAVRKADVAQGLVTLDLSGKGTIADPAFSGNIAATRLKVRGKPLNDVRLNLNLADGLARISGDAGFDLTATYHLKKQDFEATINFKKTDLAPYFRLADQTQLGGVLSGQVQARGNAASPDAVAASVDFSDLILKFDGKEIIATKDLTATYRDGVASIPGFSLNLLKKGYLAIKGQADLGGSLSINVDGDIPLDVAQAFTDALPDIKGKVALSADILGQTAHPQIRADATLQNIAMSVPGIAQQLNDFNGKIHITTQSLTLKDMGGKLDDGAFFIKGQAKLDNFKPIDMDITLTAENLPVSVPDMMDMSLNADLNMAGTPESSAIKGEAVILEGTYYKDVNLSLLTPLKGLTQKKRETAPTRPPKKPLPGKSSEPSILDNLALDIFVKNRAPFLVDNDLAYMEIDPDLHVKGTLDNPLVAGRAEIRNGSVNYQKRTFDITKGVIDFINPYKIEPTLDISANAEIRKWQVVLSISGTPDALNVNFSSKPTLDDNDILSLILLGRTSSEMISGEGGTTAAPGQMVADIVSNTVGDDIKKATGLDILEVEMDDEEGGADVKVTMGKELSRRMSVKYSVESRDGEMVGRTSAEYKILENLLMSGFQDNAGTFGGELKFRLEFR